MYTKHAKFRELDEARKEGNADESLPKSPQQADVQLSQCDENVSFSIALQKMSLRYPLYFADLEFVAQVSIAYPVGSCPPELTFSNPFWC